MKTAIITAFALILALLVSQFKPPVPDAHAKTVSVNAQSKVVKKEIVQPSAAPVPPPVPRWIINMPVNGVSPEKINVALSIYQDMGLTKTGAAFIVGNFLHESPTAFTDPCKQYGDGGLALGFGQWHPGRRVDMPCTVVEQLKWAVATEMPRDARNNGYASLDARLRTDDANDIMRGIRQWERYGIEGKRYYYGQIIFDAIK